MCISIKYCRYLMKYSLLLLFTYRSYGSLFVTSAKLASICFTGRVLPPMLTRFLFPFSLLHNISFRKYFQNTFQQNHFLKMSNIYTNIFLLILRYCFGSLTKPQCKLLLHLKDKLTDCSKCGITGKEVMLQT